MGKIAELRTILERRKGQQLQLVKTLMQTKLELKQNQRSLRHHEQARELIRIAGEETQKSLSYHISEITSLALEAVFDDPYTLEVDFVNRRNRTECDLYFSRDGNRVDPMDASGGGAVDVASFALRIASWSMMHPRLRNTIILDEPMKNLSKDMQDKASLMLKEVSNKLGIQFICVTHEEQLASYADRTFLITKNKKGISKVTVIENENESLEH
jgi:DNA repair exonuclease SbcCD ATPase subunit